MANYITLIIEKLPSKEVVEANVYLEDIDTVNDIQYEIVELVGDEQFALRRIDGCPSLVFEFDEIQFYAECVRNYDKDVVDFFIWRYDDLWDVADIIDEQYIMTSSRSDIIEWIIYEHIPSHVCSDCWAEVEGMISDDDIWGRYIINGAWDMDVEEIGTDNYIFYRQA